MTLNFMIVIPLLQTINGSECSGQPFDLNIKKDINDKLIKYSEKRLFNLYNPITQLIQMPLQESVVLKSDVFS